MEKILQACIVFIFHGQNHLVLLYNILLQYQAHRHQGDLLDIKFFYKKNIKLFKNYLNQLVLIDIKQGCQGDFLDIKNVSLTLKDVNSFNIQHLTVKKRFCP